MAPLFISFLNYVKQHTATKKANFFIWKGYSETDRGLLTLNKEEAERLSKKIGKNIVGADRITVVEVSKVAHKRGWENSIHKEGSKLSGYCICLTLPVDEYPDIARKLVPIIERVRAAELVMTNSALRVDVKHARGTKLVIWKGKEEDKYITFKAGELSRRSVSAMDVLNVLDNTVGKGFPRDNIREAHPAKIWANDWLRENVAKGSLSDERGWCILIELPAKYVGYGEEIVRALEDYIENKNWRELLCITNEGFNPLYTGRDIKKMMEDRDRHNTAEELALYVWPHYAEREKRFPFTRGELEREAGYLNLIKGELDGYLKKKLPYLMEIKKWPGLKKKGAWPGIEVSAIPVTESKTETRRMQNMYGDAFNELNSFFIKIKIPTDRDEQHHVLERLLEIIKKWNEAAKKGSEDTIVMTNERFEEDAEVEWVDMDWIECEEQ